jgi:hypothetical protein
VEDVSTGLGISAMEDLGKMGLEREAVVAGTDPATDVSKAGKPHGATGATLREVATWD